MKILFFGDSITDAGRNREFPNHMSALGWGFVRIIADRLLRDSCQQYEIINRGISGNRIVDLYARLKSDVWNLQPDIISILIGVNDIWHDIEFNNGVDLERFENIYRLLINDTKKALPKAEFILCEPFMLKGDATENTEEIPDRYERFCMVYKYAEIVKKLANEFDIPFVSLQEKFTTASIKYNAQDYLSDGVHPHISGASLIANEWVNCFKKNFYKD